MTDEKFARDMAAAEINVTSPTKRDRAKSKAWSDYADRIKAAGTVVVVPPPPPPPVEPPPVVVLPPVYTSGTFLRPFSDDSPWNTPAPAAGSATDPRTVQVRANLNTGGATGINIDRYSLPNYQASATDPLVTVVDVAHNNLTVQMRIPAGAVPAAGTDANMAILQPDGTLYDLWIARWASSTRIETQRLGRTSITGKGIGPAKKDDATGQWVPAGIRAAGCSWMGGMVRKHEIEAGVIPHALAMSVPGKWLRYDPPPYYGNGSGEHIIGERGETTGALLGHGNYRGYVPPATEQDHNSAWGNYTTGVGIPMGTRFVLPKTFDISTLNPSVRLMAKAAQTHGVLTVDQTDKDPMWVMFYAEPAVASLPFASQWWSDDSLTRMRQALVVAV